MTENSSYLIGKLGKPHGLQGYQYINIDKYFRDINMNDVSVVVDNHSYQIEDFKSHLKDRNLINLNISTQLMKLKIIETSMST